MKRNDLAWGMSVVVTDPEFDDPVNNNTWRNKIATVINVDVEDDGSDFVTLKLAEIPEGFHLGICDFHPTQFEPLLSLERIRNLLGDEVVRRQGEPGVDDVCEVRADIKRSDCIHLQFQGWAVQLFQNGTFHLVDTAATDR